MTTMEYIPDIEIPPSRTISLTLEDLVTTALVSNTEPLTTNSTTSSTINMGSPVGSPIGSPILKHEHNEQKAYPHDYKRELRDILKKAKGSGTSDAVR
jgi:hypothetical protein